MKNINDKTRKWITIAGISMMCVVLVIAISFQFKTEKPTDGGIAPSANATGQVNPSADAGGEVVIPANQPADGTADQTDQPVQNLQPEATKPAEPSASQKTDPSQKPSGEKVDKVQPTDHDSVKRPDAPQTGEPKGGEKKDGQVYLPGFGWVTETGGSGTTADGDGDIDKQVGTMD